MLHDISVCDILGLSIIGFASSPHQKMGGDFSVYSLWHCSCVAAGCGLPISASKSLSRVQRIVRLLQKKSLTHLFLVFCSGALFAMHGLWCVPGGGFDAAMVGKADVSMDERASHVEISKY
jgi:hypothetical protein